MKELIRLFREAMSEASRAQHQKAILDMAVKHALEKEVKDWLAWWTVIARVRRWSLAPGCRGQAGSGVKANLAEVANAATKRDGPVSLGESINKFIGMTLQNMAEFKHGGAKLARGPSTAVLKRRQEGNYQRVMHQELSTIFQELPANTEALDHKLPTFVMSQYDSFRSTAPKPSKHDRRLKNKEPKNARTLPLVATTKRIEKAQRELAAKHPIVGVQVQFIKVQVGLSAEEHVSAVVFKVPSTSSESATYDCTIAIEPQCTCADYATNGKPIVAVCVKCIRNTTSYAFSADSFETDATPNR